MNIDRERAKNVFMAKLAEQAERYDEMVGFMKNVARLDVVMSVEERNLLSMGYKNVIGARRASWRILSSIEQKEEVKGNLGNVKLIDIYRQQVEDELSNICFDILSVIDRHLIPNSGTSEAAVFYFKMKGDYNRYLAEFKVDQEKKEAAQQSHMAYETAMAAASTELPSTHPIRLGLALNFSVFFYEILSCTERACHIAKQAFDEAIAELDTLSEECYKDSTLIMQLLRDNLTLWTSILPEDGGDENVKVDESKPKEPQDENVKVDESKPTEPQDENVKVDESKPTEPQDENVKVDESKPTEPQDENVKIDESKPTEPQDENVKLEEAKPVETSPKPAETEVKVTEVKEPEVAS